MNEYAVPQHLLSAAKLLDHEAFNLRTGASRPAQVAERLRLIADMAEQKI